MTTQPPIPPAADRPGAALQRRHMLRRLARLGGLGAVGLAGLGAAALAGCGSASPPVRWYALRREPPPGEAVPAAAPGASGGDVWAVSPALRLPGVLDRDTLGRADGAAGWQPLPGHRWAEPLREALPRLLVGDLARLRGAGRVWPAPVPAGVAATRRLEVEVLTLQSDTARPRSLRLAARWWLTVPTPLPAPAAGAAGPVAPVAPVASPQETLVEVALADESPDALAAGHRLALWRLAERIAAAGRER